MKMIKEDFAFLETLMTKTMDEAGLENLKNYKKYLVYDKRVQDLEMRFRWDIFWNTDRTNRLEFLDKVKYLHDAHINTALKKIVDNYMKG